MKRYLFDQETGETKHYTVGQWIVAVMILAMLAGLFVFTMLTWIKLTWFIWGW